MRCSGHQRFPASYTALWCREGGPVYAGKAVLGEDYLLLTGVDRNGSQAREQLGMSELGVSASRAVGTSAWKAGLPWCSSTRPDRRCVSLSSTAAGHSSSSPNGSQDEVLALFHEQSACECVAHELGAGPEAKLLHDVRAVRLGRADRDVEHLCDLLVGVAEREQP